MQPQRPVHEPSDAPFPRGTQSRARQVALIGAVIVVVAALTSSVLFFLNSRDNDDVATDADTPTYVITQAASTQPVFEPRGAEGEQAFFPIDVQLASFTAATGGEVEPGDVESGLYGGTVENTCDPERLIDYLYSNPAKARAWAAVQEISVGEIDTYIRSLDARVLAAPAAVINHGFDDRTGAPTAVDTTLDAGTAVLVDADGNIRTRCYCGNPVTPRPVTFREPHCLTTTLLVFSDPAAGTSIGGVPQQVEATGRVTIADSYPWSEITWGDAPGQTAWVADADMRPGLCPPSAGFTRRCANPETPVWDDPSDPSPIGRLGGEVRTAAASQRVSASVSLIDDTRGSVSDGEYVLIEFSRAAPSAANSAWVRTSDLGGGECGPVRVCVSTATEVTERAGGLGLRPAGEHLVEFTGHFAAEPGTHAEVLFGDGAPGWISEAYEPLPNDSCRSELPPGNARCVAGPATLESSERLVVGVALAVRVHLTGDGPTDERVEVELNPGGERVWVDESELSDGGHCRPRRVCADVANVRSPRAATGELLPIPAGPVVVDLHGVEFRPGGFPPVHVMVGWQGRLGWIELSELVVASGGACDDFGGGPVTLPIDVAVPTATPTPAATATASPTPAPEPSPTPTTIAPQPTATANPAPPPTATPEVTPTPTTPAVTCPDADGDGICNVDDNCRDVFNAGQLDKDNDGKGNACDDCTDQDRDLHCAETDDTCPNDYDPALLDTDFDGIGDACDNCPIVANANQADANGDDIGDACETGDNGDCSAAGYLGLDRGSAEAKASRNRCVYRIIRIDGENFPGTTDYVPTRMNWQIDNNIVTTVTLG